MDPVTVVRLVTDTLTYPKALADEIRKEYGWLAERRASRGLPTAALADFKAQLLNAGLEYFRGAREHMTRTDAVVGAKERMVLMPDELRALGQI